MYPSPLCMTSHVAILSSLLNPPPPPLTPGGRLAAKFSIPGKHILPRAEKYFLKPLQRTFRPREKPPAQQMNFFSYVLFLGTILACLVSEPDSVTRLNLDRIRIQNAAGMCFYIFYSFLATKSVDPRNLITNCHCVFFLLEKTTQGLLYSGLRYPMRTYCS